MADQPDLHAWGPLLDDLRGRKERAAAMGGTDLVARQRSLGKLPVRERLDLLLVSHGEVECEVGMMARDSSDHGGTSGGARLLRQRKLEGAIPGCLRVVVRPPYKLYGQKLLNVTCIGNVFVL